MANKKKARQRAVHVSRLSAFMTSVSLVFTALAYMAFGEDFADVLKFVDYPKLIRYFTASVPEGQIEVHVIDVGQADSILIRTPDGDMLIDAGTSDVHAELKAHLISCGVDDLAYFVCTHPHEDHIGSADEIVKSFDIGTILMPDCTANTMTFEQLMDAIEQTDTEVVIPRAGDTFTLGDAAFRILAPLTESEETNDMSLVLRLTYGATAFMFTGDAEGPSERAMLDEYSRMELDCDFLKLGHHGSSSSTTEDFLAAVSPDVAVISCGRDNDYGHPHKEILSRLTRAGIDTILRTDTMGTVIVVSDGTKIAAMN